MDDSEIVRLLFDRSELAISAIKSKYGQTIRKIISNILCSEQDVEECIDDTLLSVWNTVPPNKPKLLKAYIFKIARNAALKVMPMSERTCTWLMPLNWYSTGSSTVMIFRSGLLMVLRHA